MKTKLNSNDGILKVWFGDYTYTFSRTHGFEGRANGGSVSLNTLKELAKHCSDLQGEERKIAELGFRDYNISISQS